MHNLSLFHSFRLLFLYHAVHSQLGFSTAKWHLNFIGNYLQCNIKNCSLWLLRTHNIYDAWLSFVHNFFNSKDIKKEESTFWKYLLVYSVVAIENLIRRFSHETSTFIIFFSSGTITKYIQEKCYIIKNTFVFFFTEIIAKIPKNSCFFLRICDSKT